MKLCAALLITVTFPLLSHAQLYRRFEVGTSTTALRIASETSNCGGCPAAKWAIGPSFTFNLNQHFALDASANVFPKGTEGTSDAYGGHLTEVLGGLKATLRGSRFALFTKARPGFVSWSHTVKDVEFLRNPPRSIEDIQLSFARKNLFALNLMGGIEYALTPRVSVSSELGDTLIRPKNRFGLGSFANNLEASSGVYYHLGELRGTDLRHMEWAHRFFDSENLAMMTVSLLAQTADAITTQRRLGRCWRSNPTPHDPLFGCAQMESNPIARPFVAHGWGGQLSLALIVNSAETAAMYAIHRMGYHKVERVVPLALAAGSGIEAYRNLQQ